MNLDGYDAGSDASSVSEAATVFGDSDDDQRHQEELQGEGTGDDKNDDVTDASEDDEDDEGGEGDSDSSTGSSGSSESSVSSAESTVCIANAEIRTN